ncbi:hypothetical protein FCM35_KLT14917 [Carex littledalei]|uniref:Uncharacterized protein n=1 Tax=Carex littledalei TaxID=544730 RepID=A0A833QID6_9POAL|nr:hypothetical protein FCM35_KLT14917 [Carex littledalei]
MLYSTRSSIHLKAMYIIVLVILASQLDMLSEARPLIDVSKTNMQRRWLLEQASTVRKGALEAISPSVAGILVDIEDVRPSNPGHSPGVGHR